MPCALAVSGWSQPAFKKQGMPEFLLQVHRQAVPRAPPEPAEAYWVTSVTVWFHSRLLGAYNLPGSSEMHLRWGNTSVLYITFGFFYWFQLEKGQIWRSTNKCRSYTALWQTSREDENSASLLAHLTYFCLLPVLKVTIRIPSVLGGAVIQDSWAREKETFPMS